ncbi:unnamed protein product [Arctogadus glacialis]
MKTVDHDWHGRYDPNTAIHNDNIIQPCFPETETKKALSLLTKNVCFVGFHNEGIGLPAVSRKNSKEITNGAALCPAGAGAYTAKGGRAGQQQSEGDYKRRAQCGIVNQRSHSLSFPATHCRGSTENCLMWCSHD